MDRQNYLKTGGSYIDPLIFIWIIIGLSILFSGYWYTNIYNNPNKNITAKAFVLSAPSSNTVMPSSGSGSSVPSSGSSVPIVAPPAGAVISTCTFLEELVNGKCLVKCSDGQERIGETCLIKCADGKIRSGVTCINDPAIEQLAKTKFLEMKNKLLSNKPIMYGGSGNSTSFDFNCDKDIDDHIMTISGKKDETGIRKLQFKCKSDKISTIYGIYDNPNATEFTMDIDSPYNTISGKDDDYIRKIGDNGIDVGKPWITTCPGNEMIRGVVGKYDTSFDSLGFRCA